MNRATDNIISLDHTRGIPHRHEQVPLVLRWETRRFWVEICRVMDCTEGVASIMLALWSEAVTGGKWISYSRNKQHYPAGSVFYKYHVVVPGVDFLRDAGLIDHFLQVPFSEDMWQSCMIAKPELVAIVEAAIAKTGMPHSMRLPPIVLRDRQGNDLPFVETDELRWQRLRIEGYNEALRAAAVSGGCADVRRIYTGSLDRGGRLYAIGGSWQVKSEWDRSLLTINGEKVCELDYKAQHPSMIYSDAGMSVPTNAYEIGDWPRKLTKLAFLVLVNAKDLEQAVHAIAKKDEVMLAGVESKSDEAIKAARAIIKDIKRHHRVIKKAFLSDCGAGLQKRDSAIIDDVAQRMLKKGETVLVVHDSVIVRETAKDVLMEVMEQATARAGLPGIRIELKVPEKKQPVRAESQNQWVTSENTLHNPCFLFSLTSPPALTVQDSLQDDSTRQNLILTTRAETAVEVESQPQANDLCNKTVAEPQALQDETPPPSHSHTRHVLDSGTTAMFKLDPMLPSVQTPTPVVTLQDDAGRDSPQAASDTNLIQKTPTQAQGSALTSMWNQKPSAMKPFTLAGTGRVAGTDSMSMWNRPQVTTLVNAPGDADSDLPAVDATVGKESILEASSAAEDGSDLNLVAEESIQVEEIESGTVGDLIHDPVVISVETVDPLMVAETESGSQESIQVAVSDSVDTGNLNRLAGIESGFIDLLLSDGNRQTGSRNLIQIQTTSHDHPGSSKPGDLTIQSSETKPPILPVLHAVTVDDTILIPIAEAHKTNTARLRRGLSRLSPDHQAIVVEALKPNVTDEDYLPKTEAFELRDKARDLILDIYRVPGEDDLLQALRHDRHHRDRDSLPSPKLRGRPPTLPSFATKASYIEPAKHRMSALRR